MTSPRDLPQLQRLLETKKAQDLIARFSREEVASRFRARIDVARARLLGGVNGVALDGAVLDFSSADFFAGVAAEIEHARALNLRPVINATGIVIHTNLGRAPLAPEAMRAISDAAGGYSNLEFDLESGKRGSRHAHVEALLQDLTGAEEAFAVNNCAAAVVLCLSALAAGREVIASRGELIEIGGAFRMPDVIAQSGAKLAEVGATNKTRAKDYEAAISEDTGLLLKSHTSNFRMVGFSSAPTREELAALAKARNLPLVEDLGSGVLIDLSAYGLPDEPVVGSILKAGVDIVTFSGDKLLGGPQAGIIAGRKTLIDKIKKHPLARAVRINKLSLAALEATLRLYAPPHDPICDVPVLHSLCAPLSLLSERASRLRAMLADAPCDAEIIPSTAYAGGGSLPEQHLRSVALAVESASHTAQALSARLLRGATPVATRIHEERLMVDMRTTPDAVLPALGAAIVAAVQP